MTDEEYQKGEVYFSSFSDVRPTKRSVSLDTIKKYLLTRGFDKSLTERIVAEYSDITGGNNFQDQRRKGILYACAKRVYLTLGEPIDALSLAEKIGIEVKIASRGEDLYTTLSKNQGNPISRLECSELDYTKLLIEQLCTTKEIWWQGNDKLNLDMEFAISSVRLIIEHIKLGNKANASKSSKPRTIVSARVYFHCCALGIKINKTKYAELCGISPASIDKHHKTIVLYLQNMRDSARNQKR